MKIWEIRSIQLSIFQKAVFLHRICDRGIRFLSLADAKEKYNDSFYNVTNMIQWVKEQIQQFNTSDQPVMVCGEEGTYKEQVVCYFIF